MGDVVYRPDYEHECVQLKEELSHSLKRLDDCSRVLHDTKQDLETLKLAYEEQREELIRAEAQIEAFKFVILERR